jgi:hypothetical protein
MNIPLGHKLKVMKRIKEIRKDKGLSVPESRQGQRENNVDVNSKPFQKQELEELPAPKGTHSGDVGTVSNGLTRG